MPRPVAVGCVLALLLIWPAAVSAAEDTIEELKSKAAKAERGKRAKLYAQLAERQVELAAKSFREDKSAEGHLAVREALKSAEEAFKQQFPAANG